MNAILITSGTFSGAEKRALKIHAHLNKSGYKNQLIINNKLYEIIANTEYQSLLEGVIVINTSYSSRRLRFYKLIILLNIYILIYNIKTIHVFLNHSILKFIFLKRNIFFEITSPDKINKIKNNIVSNVKYIAVSESVYKISTQYIKKDMLILSDKPYFNYHGKKLNNINKENIIVFAHRLISRKNGLLFAHAVKKFLITNKQWTIKIFGEGEDRSKMEEILKKEVEDGLVKIGYTNKLDYELARSKIFVSLIEPDNYPSQSILEALYQENALLISNTGKSKSKFLWHNGYTCDLNINDICNKLDNLTQSPELEFFCKNSLKLIKDQYNPNLYINDLIQTYSTR